MMFKLVHSGSKTFCCWQLQVIQAAECVIIHAELNLQLDNQMYWHIMCAIHKLHNEIFPAADIH